VVCCKVIGLDGGLRKGKHAVWLVHPFFLSFGMMVASATTI
jgi:hypothetical protein